MADLKWDANVNKTLTDVKQYIHASIIPSLPAGIEIGYGGEEEQNNEIVPDLVKSVIIAIFIIFLILVFHFGRLNMALLVFSSATLTLFGAAFGLWVLGLDVSVTTMLAVVSLIGIVVRNGIIMFDYADKLRTKQNMPVREAAFEAGKRRLRPIFLTSAAASMGVLPMIISKDLLWMPVGTVICFGTLISMLFVVTTLPVAYWLIFRE